jgi:hypothetical protein
MKPSTKKSPPLVHARPQPQPSDDQIREYAYHLYLQSRCVEGRDLDNWLEATACLKANIPAHRSHSRLHQHLGELEREAVCDTSLEARNLAS